MLYFLAIILSLLSALTFRGTSDIFDLPNSPAAVVGSAGFGLIAASLPMFKDRRTLKDALICTAIFAVYLSATLSFGRSGPRNSMRGNFSFSVARPW